jgi:hypothetical protein
MSPSAGLFQQQSILVLSFAVGLFAGSRMLHDLLRREGFTVGRKYGGHADDEEGHRSA